MPQQEAAGPRFRRLGPLAALAVAVAVFLAVATRRHGYFDLKVYYGALNFWVHDGGMLYDFLKPGTKYGFTYPPFAAITMLPMAYVAWPVAMVVSTASTIVSTALLLWWLCEPIARRLGRPRWLVLGVAVCLTAALDPVRETVTFGQVNTLLLFLVGADLLLLLSRGSRWAGVGIGLATAIKLTPGIFLVYLLVTGRWRAAATATATAAAATLFSALVAPDASREFWTAALWNTDRVGDLEFVSNQSLQGLVARLNPEHPSALLWAALVVATLGVWAWRSRRAAGAGDEAAGLALTGVVGCLVSPVTWTHHLVWLLPALVLLVDSGLRAGPATARRRGLWATAAGCYVVLISAMVWLWEHGWSGPVGLVGSNAYVWVSVVLLVVVPVERDRLVPGAAGRIAGVAQPWHAGRRRTAGAAQPEDRALPVRG